MVSHGWSRVSAGNARRPVENSVSAVSAAGSLDADRRAMQINAELEIGAPDSTELAKILSCTAEELAGKLALFASAAIHEYVSMFLGQRVFRRGSDINEYRLFLLITKALDNCIPDEQTVSRLFQTSTTESRTLIRAVMSKYQYQLRDAIDASMRRIIQAAGRSDTDGTYEVIVNSVNMVEELNRALASIDETLQPIAKKRGSVSTYEVSPTSYERLMMRFVQE